MTNNCPDVQVWQDLLAGRLEKDREEMLAAHLDQCDRCRQTVDDEARANASAGQTDDQGADDNRLRQVLARLRGTPPTTAPDESEIEAVLRQLDPPTSDSQIGRQGRYEVQRVLGSGGFGVVLGALDPELRRPVAIKVLAPRLAAGKLARQRFTQEARAVAAIRDEHVVAIHDVGSFKNEWPYFVMEYVDGQSLKEKLQRCGQLSLVEILRIGQQIARGLAAAHAHGLVHRDVTPANILLENGVDRVKLTDFGLVRAAGGGPGLTEDGTVLGTPEYMAPEQYRGEPVDHRTDLFSLGTVHYQLCTGQTPFRASTPLATLKRVYEETPRFIRSINPSIPPWLEALIARLHAKAAADRFQGAAEVADLLDKGLRYVQQSASELDLPAELAALAGGNRKEMDMGTKVGDSSLLQNRSFKILAVAAGLLLLATVGVVGLISALGRPPNNGTGVPPDPGSHDTDPASSGKPRIDGVPPPSPPPPSLVGVWESPGGRGDLGFGPVIEQVHILEINRDGKYRWTLDNRGRFVGKLPKRAGKWSYDDKDEILTLQNGLKGTGQLEPATLSLNVHWGDKDHFETDYFILGAAQHNSWTRVSTR
jgi:serine/threonine-protein kinase